MRSMYMYPCIQRPEVEPHHPLQALLHNQCTTMIMSLFYPEIKNSSERAIHEFVQVLVQAHKSVFAHLNCLFSRINFRQDKCLYILHTYCSQ